ncbi:MAG TPA: SDR family NAD(P)-dependent oxidoreductase [Aliidongia sp.]|uniref:SDR family NAD(P)-dependent oxidoreductase n=1 Tax=Aliidongia sp. TaxID=1914230 RepID=UPI002DDD0E61|nr:SDR family NAD(P)-dependent oxidoreductase [Aliidongia sp.]HEV2673000.1 SDR family NAD(P)-dependent oxidoreductase [Aliidongia sp.]
MLLKNKIALVTGSSRGIGAAIARRFAAEGARVAVHGRDGAARAQVLREIRERGGTAIEVEGDVTSFAAIEALRTTIEARLGPVEILVANAGGNATPPGPLEEISEAGWRASIDGNLTATFLTLKSFLPGMKARRAGSIVTLSSAAARKPPIGAPIAYACAKAGIILLTQDAAAQVGPDGIRVNCIAPETILTDRNRQRIPAATQEMLVGTHPLRRLGTPEDVAEAALYLASPQSGWVSGIVLDVAGGAVMV